MEDIWRIPLDTLSRKKSFFIRQLRVIILSFRGFVEDKCGLRASALTFYSVLSVVPAVAMVFGLAKGFALEKLLEREIIEGMKGQEQVADWIITLARSALENTRGSLIAGIGVALLFWLIFRLLENIESSFNHIWGVRRSRTIGRKLTDYLSIILICPVLLIVSSSLTVFISTQITHITQRIAISGEFSSLVLLSLKTLPYCITWLLLTFVYIFLPNTKVRLRSGFLGGVVAGTIYGLVQWGYIAFQVGAARYGAIYGSLAALPLFLVWLQVSWLIVLFGAEISFASQNVETYEFEPDYRRISPLFKRLLALRIAHVCIKNFCAGDRPWSVERISHALKVPIRLANLILSELVQARVLTEVREVTKGRSGYQPARDPDNLSLSNVIDALERSGSNDLPVVRSGEFNKISSCLDEFRMIVDKSQANLLLKDI
ncbi:MAG: YihY family inner membrane protein [Desulfobacterales bacterium]|nr:YihY family inner membrane protein [Desulfobacterales bacterium]